MLDDRVAVFWDFENCSISFKSPDFNIVDRIRDVALQYGRIVSFKVYGEVKPSTKSSSTSSRIFSQLQCAGASTTHTPHNGFKEVADKMMLVDMMLFAMDNNPPAVVVLITGDKDFAYILSILRFRGYKTVLIAPSAAHASVTNRAQSLHDWEEEILGVARLPSPPSRRSTQNSDCTMMSSSTESSAEDSVPGMAGAASTVNLSTTAAASGEKREQLAPAPLPDATSAAVPVAVSNAQEAAAEVKPDTEPESTEKQVSASAVALPPSLPDPTSHTHTEDVRPLANEQANAESDPGPSLEPDNMALSLVNNQSRVTFATTESEERPSRVMHREPVNQRINRALRASSPTPCTRPARPVSPPPSVSQQDNSSFSFLNPISRMSRLMFGNKKLSRTSPMATHSTMSLAGPASCSNFSLAGLSADGYGSDSSSSGSDSDAAAKDAAASTSSTMPSPQSNPTSVTPETKPATAASTELQSTLNVASSGNAVDVTTSVSPPRTTASGIPVGAAYPASGSSATSAKVTSSTDKPKSIIILSNETTTKAAPSASKSSSPSPPAQPVIKPTAASQTSQAATSSTSASPATNAPGGQKSNPVGSASQPPSKATTYKPPIVAEKSALPVAIVSATGSVATTAVQSSSTASTNKLGVATVSVKAPTTSAVKPPAPRTAPVAPAVTPNAPIAATSTIPDIYATLAATLENARIKGNPRVPRTVLGQEILQKNPRVYTAAGISNTANRFKNYIAKAESAGIVVLGGQGGSAWVSLHSDWVGRVKAA